MVAEALEPGDKGPAQTFGRYVLLRHMAEESGAQVHLGRRVGGPHDGTLVAIKRVAEAVADHPDLLSQWLRRARRATKILHAATVATIDVLAGSGDLFAVQRFEPGLPLARLLSLAHADEGRVECSMLARLLCPALQGLHAAHEAADDQDEPLGIVHGNLNAERILVTTSREVVVTDFGFPLPSSDAESQRAPEALRYLAPEQLAERQEARSDRRSDIYAIGVLLWEALTGRHLFTGRSRAALLNEKGGSPVAPSAIVSDLPSSLDRVVLRALAPRPTARFRSANQLAHALEAAVGESASDAELGGWLDRLTGDRLAKLADNHHQLRQILIPETMIRQASSATDGSVTSLLAGPLRDNASKVDVHCDDELPTTVHASDEPASVSTSLPRPEPEQQGPPESWMPDRAESTQPARTQPKKAKPRKTQARSKDAPAPATAPRRRGNWLTLGLIAAPLLGLVVAAAAAKLERLSTEDSAYRSIASSTPTAAAPASAATVLPAAAAALQPTQAPSSVAPSTSASAAATASATASQPQSTAAPKTARRPAPRVATRRRTPPPATPTPRRSSKKKKKKKKGPEVDIVSDYGY